MMYPLVKNVIANNERLNCIKYRAEDCFYVSKDMCATQEM